VKIRVRTTVGACFCLIGATPLSADWRDEIGYTRLKLLAAAELPAAPSQGFTQVEAPESSGNFLPDTTSALFTGKTFTNLSGTSGVSSHAQHVATNFYGNTTSLVAGNCPVGLYNANSWIGAGFLNTGSNSPPDTESHTVQNHSWVGTLNANFTEADATEINRRLDFAINRDGFVSVVGVNNGNSTILPAILGQSYHTISVGRDDNGHSAGFTTLDFIASGDAGRIKPDIVAPSAAPEYATSWTTPMVASAAGLLYSKLAAAPYSLAGADKPRVIKSLLLATATKNTVPSWSNTPTRPLDLRYGAGELNICHAYNALRAGRETASSSILRKSRGWAAESVAAGSPKTYFFNIAAGAPSTPFSAALTWHRVITDNLNGPSWGNLSTTLANLNLRLYQASGFALGSEVAASLSSVDNVELVYQSALPPGNYALVVESTSSTSTPYALAWHSLPAVTVVATTPTAREIDSQAGLVTITRTGDTTLPLFVPITVGGSAVSGTHFQALPASVTLAAGQASTTLQIVPVADNLAQGNRNVTVAIAADFALVRDAAQSAAITIQDKPFDSWRFANFSNSEITNPAISAETADPDGDNLANLLEYALALHPKLASISPVTTGQSGGYLTIASSKNTAATDILWTAEVTADLATWQSLTPSVNTASNFAASDFIRSDQAAQRFMRLKITRP
jgi:hypothetical protein